VETNVTSAVLGGKKLGLVKKLGFEKKRGGIDTVEDGKI
jgi:hypothetical protein